MDTEKDWPKYYVEKEIKTHRTIMGIVDEDIREIFVDFKPKCLDYSMVLDMQIARKLTELCAKLKS